MGRPWAGMGRPWLAHGRPSTARGRPMGGPWAAHGLELGSETAKSQEFKVPRNRGRANGSRAKCNNALHNFNFNAVIETMAQENLGIEDPFQKIIGNLGHWKNILKICKTLQDQT